MDEHRASLSMDRRQFIKGTLIGAGLLALEYQGFSEMAQAADSKGPVKLAPLPYSDAALAPSISEMTITYHYGKHHKGYVDKTNELTANTDLARASLEDIVKKTAGKSDQETIFNNAAQVWNHEFFWSSMKPGGGGAPTGKLAKAMDASFGSYDKFKEAFSEAAATLFGSGWVWLTQERGKLKILQTGNADTPIAHGVKPLLTLDVWEHAYYLDYKNNRKDYIAAYLDRLVNWDFAAKNLA